MNPSGEGDPAEGKRLLELVAFAQRDQDSWRFTWRHGMFIGLAFLGLLALHALATWRSFHRPLEVHVEPGVSPADQDAMLAAIRASNPWVLDRVPMDSATFRSVLLGQQRLERVVTLNKEMGQVRAEVYRFDSGTVWSFTLGKSGHLSQSVSARGRSRSISAKGRPTY
jgi:hypothetical protein